MDKAIFHGEIANMMNKDSHWTGGNRTFTENEMNTFIEHMWKFMQEQVISIDARKLFFALMQARRLESLQDQSEAIIRFIKKE
ncbi:MAG: hypothetical protein G01um101470_392 [Parcubacteria group bacterium Gr01-1014_70]|nr:MAG: hypothetical protein G01um101470_392 [Parcubacteria group bacterium Gr01-1014_70]